MSIVQVFSCPQCGAPVAGSSGGWFCPNGHVTPVTIQTPCGEIPEYGSRGPAQGTVTILAEREAMKCLHCGRETARRPYCSHHCEIERLLLNEKVAKQLDRGAKLLAGTDAASRQENP